MLGLLFALLAVGCQNDDTYTFAEEESLDNSLLNIINERLGSAELLVLPNNDYTRIPSDPKNKITLEKVRLGKFLFHETGLALAPKQEESKGTYSCASCHHAKAGFQSGLKQGIGEGGIGFGLFGENRVVNATYDLFNIDVQPLRSPTILNTAYQDVMLWNGQFGGTKSNIGTASEWTEGTPKENNHLGFEGVETQAIAGLGVHRLVIDSDMIISNHTYKDLFDQAFAEVIHSERYSKLNGALAIAAYERTVVASEAPFQKWLRGDTNAMSDTSKKGAVLFFGKGECYTCHSGPGLNGMDFHALGMSDFREDEIIGSVTENDKKGRGGFTKNPEDDYKFKTPTLYNLKGLQFLGHGGSFNSIEEIIAYKNEGTPQNTDVPNSNLSPLFIPLGLTEEEISQLVFFIEEGLYDNNLNRFVPESLPTEQCFPNSDAQSKIDMGCD